MKRREFLLASGASAALIVAHAAAQSKPPRVALILLSNPDTADPLLGAFTERLKELGYAEGRDVVIEKRWYGDKFERLPGVAREVVSLNPAVIVTVATPATMAIKNATRTIPVVFIAVTNPDTQGFVASLARPGGNMTGTSFRADAMDTKLLEAVRATMPSVRRAAVIDPAGDPVMARLRRTAKARFEALRIDAEFVPVKDAGDLGRAIDEVARRKFDLLYMYPLALLTLNARRIAELALERRLVLVGTRRLYADAGGLMSYDNDLKADFNAAAGFVHRILKGAKPGDLPVEQPDRYQLVLNLRTAKALGIRFPQSVLLQATEVIE
jgi:putative tryptophan/tyrosine transport system substrate-binding protein